MNAQRPALLPEIHFGSWDRLSEYATSTGAVLNDQLGWGYEGLVFSTAAKTAVKSYRHEHLYRNERDVYLRLQQRSVTSVGQFRVPELLKYNDQLLVVEMTIVSRPFILDFAGAYLDKKPPYDAEQWEEWEREKIEQFEDRWPEVRKAMAQFRRHGIYLNDIKPGNVEFGV